MRSCVWATAFASVILTGALGGCAAPAAISSARSPESGLPGAPKPSATALTIPVWTRSFTYGGITYAVQTVGTDPSNGPATTIVPVVIVPLKFTFANGKMVDASGEGAELARSPIFTTTHFSSGNTQFGDAVERAEFWNVGGSGNWHVLLGTPNIVPTNAQSIPMSAGWAMTTGSGTVHGMVDYAWFVGVLEPQVVSQLNIPPTTLTIFITKNFALVEPNGHCCYKGYHSSWTRRLGSGVATFTTVWASVSATSVDTMSHEVAEWLNDPFYTNMVPSWVSPISHRCGDNLLEVGDPVTNVTFTAGGYQLQDIAYYSWFSRDMPSLGMNGAYDFRGALNGPAANCS